MDKIRNYDSKIPPSRLFDFPEMQYFTVEPKPSEDTSLNI